MKDKLYSVSVETSTFYVEVEAQDEDQAHQKVQEMLENGQCTNEADQTYYMVGHDIEEVDVQEPIKLNIKSNENRR